jgi:hypothetical protein
MISKLTVQRATNEEPPQFEVGYFDHEKKRHKGYLRTKKHGTERKMRLLLESFGVSDEEVDKFFSDAKS